MLMAMAEDGELLRHCYAVGLITWSISLESIERARVGAYANENAWFLEMHVNTKDWL